MIARVGVGYSRGESIPQGLIREIEEESGILVVPEEFVGVYCNTSAKEGYNGVKEIPSTVNFDFICRYQSGSPKPSEESKKVEWFSREEAMGKLVFPPYIDR